jgi:hypothetical protein
MSVFFEQPFFRYRATPTMNVEAREREPLTK